MKKVLLIAVSLIVIGVIGMIFTFKNSIQTTKASGNETFAAHSVNNLNIETDLANIDVVPGNSDGIEVAWEGTVKKQTDQLIKITEKADTLLLKIKPNKNRWNLLQFGEKNTKLNVTVTLPKKHLNELNIKNDIGSIYINSSHVKKLNLNSDVGNIAVHDTTAQAMNVQSELGTIKITESTGTLQAETDLGALQVQTSEIKHDMDLETGLGNILIEVPAIPENVSFDLYSDIGLVKTFDQKGGYHVPNPAYTIRATTDLGNITVKDK